MQTDTALQAALSALDKTPHDGKTTLQTNSGRHTEALPKIKAPQSARAWAAAENKRTTWLFRQAWLEAQACRDSTASVRFAQAWRYSLNAKPKKNSAGNCTPADWNFAVEYLFGCECIRTPDPFFIPSELEKTK